MISVKGSKRYAVRHTKQGGTARHSPFAQFLGCAEGFFIFRKEIKSLISRLKSAEIKDFKIELESKIEDITKDAINYGVTIAYPLETLEKQFNPDHDLPKTYVIIETWKEIEALIKNLDDRHGFHNTHNTIKYLLDNLD